MTVEKWVYGGDALARVEGRVLLTPYLLPGEKARVEAQPDGKQMLRGSDAEVLERSPERVEPPCPYFFRCGGCHYQHARYEFQVAQKAEILREQLRRVGRIDYGANVETVCGPELGYRNRTQLHFADGRIGYYAEGSHKLVAIDHCPISSPRINEAIAALAGMARDQRWPRFLRSVELFTNETEILLNAAETDRPVARHFFDWCAERIPGLAQGTLEYRCGNDAFRVGHNSFFQVNRFLADDLRRTAIADATGGSAIDLYAGVGLFSLELARRFEQVTAVESGRGAIQDLEHNAARAGLAVRAVRENVEAFLAKETARPDLVLADPPRAGLGKRAVAELARLRPPQITIVACDPATLARDVAGLLAAGYQITRVVMVDLFPQTYHIEAVVTLRLA